MMRRSVVKAHRDIAVFQSDTDDWEVEVSEPQPIAIFRFPDDSESE